MISDISTHLQQESHYLSLPAEGSFMQGSARFSLPVDVDAGLYQESGREMQKKTDSG